MARFDEPSGRAWLLGPLDDLCQMVRERVPEVTASCGYSLDTVGLRPPGHPERWIRVAYGPVGPYLIVDDGAVFLWHDGPDAGAQLGTLDRIERAVDTIAQALGVPR